MVKYHVAERIIPEDFDHFKKMCTSLKDALKTDLAELSTIPPENLPENRYHRFRSIGIFSGSVQ